MDMDLQRTIRMLLRECYRRRLLIGLAFLITSVSLTGIGATWPKLYQSSTTIYMEEHDIIEPLMKGTVVRPNMNTEMRNVKEIINGRTMLAKLMKDEGWVDESTPPKQVDNRLDSLRQRITVDNTGDNLFQISYRDPNAERAYETTEKLAAMFMDEMKAQKQRESQSAFDFIDKQVKTYEQELQDLQDKIKRVRAKDPDAMPSAKDQVQKRIVELRNRVDDVEQQIREAEIQAKTLKEQLSGEAEVANVQSREQDYRSRIADLQSKLDTLRLSYKDSYPDIVQLKRQIGDLKTQLAEERQRQKDNGGAKRLTDPNRNNPLYQQLQQKLYETTSNIKTLRVRLADAKASLKTSLARANRIEESQSKLQGITRDYDVDQEIYQSLLKQRENARVSKNLDASQQGLTLRITEPAYLPHEPTGPRLLHFALAGLFVGGLAPIGLLFGIFTVDPRVRIVEKLEDDLTLKLLDTVPYLARPQERRMARLKSIAAAAMIVIGCTATVAILALRFKGMV